MPDFPSLNVDTPKAPETQQTPSGLLSTSRSTTVLENINSGVLLIDRDWCIRYINEQAETLLFCKREKVMGRNLWELFPEAIGSAFYHEYHRALQDNVAVTVEEFYPPLNLWVEVHAYPSSDGLSIYFHDISARKRSEQALRESEERFALALEGAQDGLWDWNIQTGQVYFSPRWKSMIGYEPYELADHVDTWLEHLYPDDKARVTETLKSYFEQRCSNYEVEFRFRHKDGSYRWILARGVALFDADNKPYRMAGSHTDITPRKHLDAQIQESLATISQQNTALEEAVRKLAAANARLEALATTDGLTGLINHRAFQELLERLFHRSSISHNVISLLLLDVDRFKQYNDNHGHPAGDRVLKRLAKILPTVLRPTDLAARYGGEEFAIILPETGENEAEAVAERLRAAIEAETWPERAVTVSVGIATQTEEMDAPAVLISEADKALYYSKQRGRNCVTHVRIVTDFFDTERRILDPYTELFQQMLQTQQNNLVAASEQVKEVMAQTYDATIQSWARLLDLRDKETEGHSERVTKMTIRLARFVGMNEEEVMYVRWGALLHDIGKMGVPDHILLKPGPLTEEEWVQMRRHTTLAYEMLSPIEFLRPAIDIPYCHHEKWDGSGYPRGLKGEDIPLTARLFAVIDVYDALRFDRPYRRGWDEDKIRDYLLQQSGKHFDPRAVKAFLSLLEKERSEASPPQRLAA